MKNDKDLIICPECGGSGADSVYGNSRLCGLCNSSGKIDGNKRVCTLCGHSRNTHDGGYCYCREEGSIYKDGLRVKTAHPYECSEESHSGQFICGCDPTRPDRACWKKEEGERRLKQLKEKGVESFFKSVVELYEERIVAKAMEEAKNKKK